MDLLAEAWFNSCVPPDDRAISEWAADNLDLQPGGYAIPGFFHVNKSRHLIEPFLALHDDVTRIVSALAAIQTGKSLLSDVWIPHCLANRPGPTLLTMQNQQIASDHAEVRLMPNIRNCKGLRRLLPDNRHKIRSNEIIFKNSVPLYVRGPALGNAQSKSIRYLSIDEAWLLALDHPGRIYEFLARTSKYDELGTSKTLITSQGGTVARDAEGEILGDDWAKIWFGGDQSLWTIPCLVCGHTFVPRWSIDVPGAADPLAGMKYDANGGQVRYECPKCRQAMIDLDSTKAQWNDRGFYSVTNPLAPGQRSFQWPKWISGKWEPLVGAWLRALQSRKSGLLGPLRLFLQKECAEFWNEQAQTLAEEIKIQSSDFAAGPKKEWAEERFRFMSVDCQANLLLFYVVIRAWAGNGESRRLWRGHLESFEAVRLKQLEYGVPSKFVGIDCGYEATKVFRQCCRHVDESGRGWTAFRESDRESFTHHFKERTEQRVYSEADTASPILGLKNEDTLKWLASVSEPAAKLYRRGLLRCVVITWSRPSVSDILAGLRDGKGAPFLGPAADEDDPEEVTYRRHMASEKKRMVRLKGSKVEIMGWVKEMKGENHYWSCEKINVNMALMAGSVKPEKGFEEGTPAVTGEAAVTPADM